MGGGRNKLSRTSIALLADRSEVIIWKAAVRNQKSGVASLLTERLWSHFYLTDNVTCRELW
jgi:hypothetical protein